MSLDTSDSTGASAVPCFQKAIVQSQTGQPIFADHVPVPPLLLGTALVKTAAVALNPYDYKMGTLCPSPGAIIGIDFAGIVVKIMDETLTKLRIGDAVFGTVHGSNPVDGRNGAFAEYVRAPIDLLLRVPEGLAMENAVTLGLGLSTAVCALWAGGLRLDVTPDAPAKEPWPVLVYGASTSIGTIAIQLLRLAGLFPIAICSPRNFELVRDRGAGAVFDYAEPGAAEQVRLCTGGRLRYALDCIADTESVAFCHAAIGRTGGRYACLEVCPDELRTRRSVKVELVMALEVFGEELALPGAYFRPRGGKARDVAASLFPIFQTLLDSLKIRPHPVAIVPGGFVRIPDSIRLLKSGKVSGKKLVALI
ncbi:hypothetical protein MGN70_003792 [Eutypa lata]|nr:hypothetical protein MGN70_003792 [Eutypa lata]